MAKNLKLVIEQKVVDDTYYVQRFLWSVVNEESGKVIAFGEEKDRESCRASAKKYL